MVEALQDTNIKMMYVNAYNPICLQDEDGPVQGNFAAGNAQQMEHYAKGHAGVAGNQPSVRGAF